MRSSRALHRCGFRIRSCPLGAQLLVDRGAGSGFTSSWRIPSSSRVVPAMPPTSSSCARRGATLSAPVAPGEGGRSGRAWSRTACSLRANISPRRATPTPRRLPRSAFPSAGASTRAFAAGSCEGRSFGAVGGGPLARHPSGLVAVDRPLPEPILIDVLHDEGDKCWVQRLELLTAGRVTLGCRCNAHK